MFLKQIPEELQNIEHTIEINDIQKLRDLCHKIKSSFDIFGLQKVSELLGQLSDDMVNGKDKTELCKQMDTMRSMLEIFYPELENKIRELQP